MILSINKRGSEVTNEGGEMSRDKEAENCWPSLFTIKIQL